MKILLATIVLAAAPGLALAQAPQAKPAKSKASDVVRKRGGKKVPKTAEEKVEIDDDPAVVLTPAELETAKKVYVGDIKCELGAVVHVTPHKREGFFIVRTGLQRFRMHPVESRTGAIRLEDPVAGAMWLQLSNKSMLMSQKFGMRLADECMSPQQAAVAEDMKSRPPINILEPAPAAAPAAPVATPAASAASQ
ncbi:MAG TPA: hypothetical protein VIE63_05325 [Ramlibacter sp.]